MSDDPIARDAAVFLSQRGSSPVGRAGLAAEGIWLVDDDGRRIMDFHGNSCHNVGYRHPGVIAALHRQLDEGPFCPRRFTNRPAVRLAERLAALWPHGDARVLFAPSGTDAIEIALKLAYVATGRRGTLAFAGAWHGAGIGALAVGGRFAEAAPLPRLDGCRHVPAWWVRPAAGDAARETAADRCLEALRAALRADGSVAALVAEPVHSTPGVPPPWLWPEIRALCDAHGTLLVFDEIPTGLGKTGTLFADAHARARPDVTVLGKSLGGAAVPLAAVIARAGLDRAGDLAIGHVTHEKSPLLAAAGLAVLDAIGSDDLVAAAARRGARLGAGLADLAARHPLVAGTAGIGLLHAVDLRAPGDAPEAAAARARAADEAAYRRGLNLTASAAGILQLTPPLVVDDAALDRALAILAEALDDAGKA